jgi:DNA-binding transcriptional MerR regulator
MNRRTIEGQMTVYEDPRCSDSGLPIEVIEAILASLLTGEKPRQIAKKLSLPREQIERVREEYARMALKDVRTWHGLAFLEKSWKIIYKALEQIEQSIHEAKAKDAVAIVTKLYDKQLLAQAQLEVSTEGDVEGSDDEIRARIQKIEDSLRRERMFGVEDAEFEETVDESMEKKTAADGSE